MFKERAEIRPEDKIEATEATKDEFLGYVIFLCHEVNTRPGNISSFRLDDGTRIEVSYIDAKIMKEKVVKNPIHAGLYVVGPENDNGMAKTTSYALYKNGEIEMFSGFIDLAEQRRITWAVTEGKELGFDLEDVLEEADRRFAAREEERSVGLTFVSEAELKKINKLLKELLEKSKNKNALHSPQRPQKS